MTIEQSYMTELIETVCSCGDSADHQPAELRTRWAEQHSTEPGHIVTLKRTGTVVVITVFGAEVTPAE